MLTCAAWLVERAVVPSDIFEREIGCIRVLITDTLAVAALSVQHVLLEVHLYYER